MAASKPKKGTKGAASRVPTREQIQRRISALAAKVDRQAATLGRTERQLEWKRDVARAAECLRLAARATDPIKAADLLRRAADLQKKAEEKQKAPSVDMINRAATINAWRRDLQKKLPSRLLVTWCEQFGRWCPKADGTITGEAHFDVPRSAQRDFEKFRQWFVDLTSNFRWLKDEPVYFALGFTVGGDMLRSSSERSRYDRVLGQSATVSYWRTSSVLPPDDPTKGSNKGWVGLSKAWIAYPTRKVPAGGTAWAVFHKADQDLSIKVVSIFVHFGPSKPVRDGEFDCETPSVASALGPTVPPTPKLPKPEKPAKPKPTRPKKPKAPKVVRMFVVYDENGRKYLNRPAYSGNVPNIWGALKDAHFFETRAKAQSAASNLNAKRPARSRYRAVVWPVDVTFT